MRNAHEGRRHAGATLAQKPKLLFCDVETTGTVPGTHGIHWIAGIIVAGRERKRFDFRVAPFPNDEIDDEALAVSRTTRKQLKQFPKPKGAHQRLVALLEPFVDRYNPNDKFLFIGYNARFDMEFLREFWKENGDSYFGSWFWWPPVDLMTITAFFLGQMRLLPDFQFPTVCKHLRIPLRKPHDPRCDVEAAQKLYEWLCKRSGKEAARV